jgi:hypothetical protein
MVVVTMLSRQTKNTCLSGSKAIQRLFLTIGDESHWKELPGSQSAKLMHASGMQALISRGKKS